MHGEAYVSRVTESTCRDGGSTAKASTMDTPITLDSLESYLAYTAETHDAFDEIFMALTDPSFSYATEGVEAHFNRRCSGKCGNPALFNQFCLLL